MIAMVTIVTINPQLQVAAEPVSVVILEDSEMHSKDLAEDWAVDSVEEDSADLVKAMMKKMITEKNRKMMGLQVVSLENFL